MNVFKPLRVSIVIPVYNEAERIRTCLEAVAAQTSVPYEVIVVDNNSTDNTAAIAADFPFVTLLSAKRQGVARARNRGFNAACGDIIGRIDADTRLPADWVETVQRLFIDDVAAVSGAMTYHDMPFSGLLSKVDLALRRRAASRMGNQVFLQGASMAIRRSAWQSVKRQLCLRGGLHEDYDLAIHLSEAGFKVVFREELKASISARCLDDTVKDFWIYALLSPGTYAQHDVRAGRHMYPIVLLILLLHVPLRALYRSANLQSSLAYRRVNPATFVD